MRAISHDHAASIAEAAATGMSGLRRRAGTLACAYRDRGVPGLAMALAGHLPGRALRVEWYEVHEVRPAADHVTEPWPHAREAAYDDADLLTAVGHVSAAEVRGRLARGDEAFIALGEDGEPLAYMWYRSGSWREDDVEYLLAGDERWGFDLYVRPEARGLRVGPRLVSVALVALHERGVRRVVSVIDHLNRASISSSLRYGSVSATSVLTIATPWAGVLRERQPGARRGRWAAYRRPAGVRRHTSGIPSGGR